MGTAGQVLSKQVSIFGGFISKHQGIWCGISYLLAGVLGLILIYIKQERQIALIGLVLSVLAAIFGIVAAGLTGKYAYNLTCACQLIGVICIESGILWTLMVMSILATIYNLYLTILMGQNTQ